MTGKELNELLLKMNQPLGGYHCVAGVLNRVPSNFGNVVIKTAVGFGFRDAQNETGEGPYASNGQDSLVKSNTIACCDVVAVQLWTNGEKYPEPLIARAKDGECLMEATWTLVPKKSISKEKLGSVSIADFLEVVPS